MYLRYLPGYVRQRFLPRTGHKPGTQDVIESRPGSILMARPNLYYLEQCGRPCWLPLFAAPQTTMPGWSNTDWAINSNWPFEYYKAEGNKDHQYQNGDWLYIVGQVRGELCERLTNEIGQRSDIWNVVQIPKSRVKPSWLDHGLLHHIPTGIEDGGGYYIAFAPDLWLGNLGWRNMVPVISNEEIRSVVDRARLLASTSS